MLRAVLSSTLVALRGYLPGISVSANRPLFRVEAKVPPWVQGIYSASRFFISFDVLIDLLKPGYFLLLRSSVLLKMKFKVLKFVHFLAQFAVKFILCFISPEISLTLLDPRGKVTEIDSGLNRVYHFGPRQNKWVFHVDKSYIDHHNNTIKLALSSRSGSCSYSLYFGPPALHLRRFPPEFPSPVHCEHSWTGLFLRASRWWSISGWVSHDFSRPLFPYRPPWIRW